jgi:hypothetical protein
VVVAVALVLLAQTARCDAALLAARTSLLRMDPARAEAALTARGLEACSLELPLIYLRGLAASRAAYAKGGDDTSLAPVRAAIAAVGERAAMGEVAEIVGFVLRASVAAAQSERDEMSVLLAQALQVERGRGARGLDGAPLLTAHEMAGDLWLQVHRFDEAAAAYRVARGYAGDSPRISIGLARALARQNQVAAACQEYRRVVTQAGALRAAMQEQRTEAEAYLRQPGCRRSSRR